MELTSTFEFKASSDAVANAIRRSILLYVPALAVHMVQFHENTTSFPDQFLAHRFSLIPVDATKALDLQPYQSCEAGKCNKCAIMGRLEVENKSNTGVMPVSWGDITGPAAALIPVAVRSQTLCWLGTGKRLRCTLWIMQGTHVQHAKWAVASTAALKPLLPTTYQLRFTTIGTLPPAEIYQRALRAAIDKLKTLATAVP